MAAQSAAVKCKVFGSSISLFANYKSSSCVFIARLHGAPSSWCKGRARRFPGKYSVDKLPLVYHGHAIHEHKGNARGILQRLFKRSLVDDVVCVKDRDIGVRAHANAPFIVKRWSALLKPLRGH